MTINSLSHTTWNCKNHIVFAPKYRRKIFLQEYRVEMGKILRELCDWKGIKIIKTEICPDYVHMFVEIQPQMSVSSFMGYLKGKSSVIFHERPENLITIMMYGIMYTPTHTTRNDNTRIFVLFSIDIR